MTILTSAYDTTACRSYKKTALHDAVVALYLMGGTTSHFGGRVHTVDVEATGSAKVPSFVYPFIDVRDGQTTSFVDMRAITSYDERNQSLRIRNQSEYDVRLIVGNIANDWAKGYTERYLLSLPLGLTVYSTWVGMAVCGRYPTDALTQLKISVLAAIFYINNFYPEDKIAHRSHKATLQSLITRHCEYVHPEVAAIVEEYSTLSDIESFCTAIREYTQSVRLRDLNVANLFEAVGGYWFGNDGRETMAVSLEYPPVWLGVLLSSLIDRSFNRTRLGDIVNRNMVKKNSENFIRVMLAKAVDVS